MSVASSLPQNFCLAPSLAMRALLLGAFLGVAAPAVHAASEGTDNNYFGDSAGGPAGTHTSAFGASAGDLNQGSDDSFFGYHAGLVSNAAENSFFGSEAGLANTSAGRNSFFGAQSGRSNVSGSDNSFFGDHAGFANQTGISNVFVGMDAGHDNIDGNNNAFVGFQAGSSNQGGTNNVFVGESAGRFNVSGSNNAYIGDYAGQSSLGADNVMIGAQAGQNGVDGESNTFVGRATAATNTNGSLNTIVGAWAGASLTTETNNTSLGAYSDIGVGAVNATAIGYQAISQQSNSLVLGSIAGLNGATATARVGMGTATPTKQLHIKGDSAGAGANNRTAIRLENVAATTAQRTMLELVNNGNSLLTFTDTSLAQSWSFQNQGSSFLFQRNGNVPFKVSDTGQIFARNGAAPNHFILSNTGNLTISGVLTQGSDVNSKKDIVALDGGDVLAKLDALPVSAWTYKTDESSARHAGPMAQDFHAVFGLGDDETRLAPGDEAGVALAAIKQLRAENQALRSSLAELTERVNRVEQAGGAASHVVAQAQ
jgi:hypothetical protein